MHSVARYVARSRCTLNLLQQTGKITRIQPTLIRGASTLPLSHSYATSPTKSPTTSHKPPKNEPEKKSSTLTKPDTKDIQEDDIEMNVEDDMTIKTDDKLLGTLEFTEDGEYLGSTVLHGEPIPYYVHSDNKTEVTQLLPKIKATLSQLDKLDETARNEAVESFKLTPTERTAFTTTGKWRYQTILRDLQERQIIANRDLDPKTHINTTLNIKLKDNEEYAVTYQGIVTTKEFKDRLLKKTPYLFFHFHDEIEEAGLLFGMSYLDDMMFNDSTLVVEVDDQLQITGVTLQ